MRERPAPRPHPLLELTRARLLEFVREPEAVFWVFVFPVLLALALGIAFRTRPPERLRAVVVRGTPGAARVAALLAGAPDLDVAVLDAAAAARALRTSRADVVVDAGPDRQDAPLAVTYRYDLTRAEGRAARLAVDDALERALGRRDRLAAREEPVTAPGTRYIDFLIPGLVGLNLMGSGMWGLGFAVVQARTRKLLKRFAATPMRRSHYLLSFILSRLVGLVLEVAFLGSLTFAGIGLLVAARPRTVEGVSGWMNLVQLPMWLASGSFFSYERFPAAARPLIRALPLTALNDALRAVIHDGAPLAATAHELLVMAAWAAVSFALALRLFRWQ